MTSTQNDSQQAASDRFGRMLAMRLTESTAELPYEVTERLRAGRMRAVAVRKQQTAVHAAAPVLATGAGALGDETFGWWARIGSVLPLLALAAGLVFIHSLQTDRRVSDIAEVDAALLSDDLPPTAYADPGFAQFLKSGRP